jgi:hypothetical protein
MNVLDHQILESGMSSEDPDVLRVHEDYSSIGLGSFTHIATDPKTLQSLIRYTSDAAHGGSFLFLEKLEEISATVLMVLLRHIGVHYIYLPSIKTLDLACAKMLVREIKQGRTSTIEFGFGFDLHNFDPEVISELSTQRYGWTDKGVFILYSEESYKENIDSLM